MTNCSSFQSRIPSPNCQSLFLDQEKCGDLIYSGKRSWNGKSGSFIRSFRYSEFSEKYSQSGQWDTRHVFIGCRICTCIPVLWRSL